MDVQQPRITRRKLLLGGAALGATAALGFAGLRQLQRGNGKRVRGFGPLRADPKGVLDLPEGFSYVLFSASDEIMTDGLRVPGAHDGMACFAGPDAKSVRLVRNHELHRPPQGPFGDDGAKVDLIDATRLFDGGDQGPPMPGGTTTVVYDLEAREVRSHHLSLGGTIRNCAGGRTPWGSWITCEENTARVGDHPELTQDHGWAFEVPSAAPGLVPARPLTAMGRFNREAVAVHEASGVVYQTEDHGDGLLYRFVPTTPGKLEAGGRLEALAIVGRPGVDTSNHTPLGTIPFNTPLKVSWIPLSAPESPEDDLRFRGRSAGAAAFARGEGIDAVGDAIYFACTSGGPAFRGQIWRYLPSPHEGTEREAELPGTLELFSEPNDSALLSNADNLTVAPFGHLIVCEDTAPVSRLVGITPGGGLYELASNALDGTEFAGATFSPDGSTLFVNMQGLGVSVAINGPWRA